MKRKLVKNPKEGIHRYRAEKLFKDANEIYLKYEDTGNLDFLIEANNFYIAALCEAKYAYKNESEEERLEKFEKMNRFMNKKILEMLRR